MNPANRVRPADTCLCPTCKSCSSRFSGFSETPLPAFYSQKSERPLNGNFGYNPTLGIVPQLSLPDNLPELGNYATFDDNTTIDWTQQQMPSIAPSFAISTLPDLNELSSNAANAPPVESPKTTGNVSFSKLNESDRCSHSFSSPSSTPTC